MIDWRRLLLLLRFRHDGSRRLAMMFGRQQRKVNAMVGRKQPTKKCKSLPIIRKSVTNDPLSGNSAF